MGQRFGTKGDFDMKMSLSADSIGELEWWVISVPTAFRVIDHGSPTITLTTDTSSVGCGATTHQSQMLTQGLWSRAEGEYHINSSRAALREARAYVLTRASVQ